MRLAFRFFVVFAVLLVLAALVLLGGYLHLRRSLPTVAGEIPTAGLHAPVEILRDGNGIPHIFAASERDAHFALGFVHAQERLWQMEMNRRIASGRLAEVVGPRGLDTDRFLRTLGIRRVAEANLAHLDAGTRAHLDAYAAGVNAFLATDPVLPPEFHLFGVAPERWTPVDSIAWGKMMAWELGGNWRSELLRLHLSRTLPPERIQEFFPPSPGDAPLALPDLQRLYSTEPRGQSIYPDPSPGAVGASNSWVAAGTRTASGKPLLANDPHLGLTAPSLWYLAHLHAPGLEVIGATLPGVPGVILGRNERIAWGLTNTGADVQDLYLEKLEGADRYRTPEGSQPFMVRTETIQVRGGAPVELTVRATRHGPVISDVVMSAAQAAPPGHALAFAWTALAEDDRSLEAALEIGRARGWSEFHAALAKLDAPVQTLTYADVEGNIALLVAGRVPLRKPANDLKGLAPAPGWDARYDWAGYVPFAELPRWLNPRDGTLVAANHKTAPAGYRHHISSEWQPPFRARRIEELLAADNRHDARGFARMQMDARSSAARALLPLLLSTQARSAEAQEALERLRAWDGTMAAERAEPLILVAWWRELARALFADELGEAFAAHWAPRAQFVLQVLEGGEDWCDDVSTPTREACAQVLSESLERALFDLRQRYGADASEWRWGEAHTALHRHRPLSGHRQLARFFEIRAPSPGDAYSLNVGRSDFGDEAEPYANRHAASYRAIYDLADPQASLFIHSGGQSGNPLSSQYASFTEAWVRGEYAPMITERARILAAGAYRLVLAPLR